MDINGSVNVHSQPLSALRNDPNTSNATEQANRLQKETQSVDEVTTEQPELIAFLNDPPPVLFVLVTVHCPKTLLFTSPPKTKSIKRNG